MVLTSFPDFNAEHGASLRCISVGGKLDKLLSGGGRIYPLLSACSVSSGWRSLLLVSADLCSFFSCIS